MSQRYWELFLRRVPTVLRGRETLFRELFGHYLEILRVDLDYFKEVRFKKRELLRFLKLSSRLKRFLKALLFKLLSYLLVAKSVYFMYLLFLSVLSGLLKDSTAFPFFSSLFSISSLSMHMLKGIWTSNPFFFNSFFCIFSSSL